MGVCRKSKAQTASAHEELISQQKPGEQEPEDRAALCPELEDTYSDKMNIIYLFRQPVFTQVLKMPGCFALFQGSIIISLLHHSGFKTLTFCSCHISYFIVFKRNRKGTLY